MSDSLQTSAICPDTVSSKYRMFLYQNKQYTVHDIKELHAIQQDSDAPNQLQAETILEGMVCNLIRLNRSDELNALLNLMPQTDDWNFFTGSAAWESAGEFNSFECVKVLQHHDECRYCESFISSAAKYRHNSLLEMCMQYDSIQIECWHTATMHLISNGEFDLVDELIYHGYPLPHIDDAEADIDMYDWVEAAAESRRSGFFEWLKVMNITDVQPSWVMCIVEAGNVHLLRELETLYPSMDWLHELHEQPLSKDTILTIARHEDISVFEWLLKQNIQFSPKCMSMCDLSFCRIGHSGIIQLIIGLGCITV